MQALTSKIESRRAGTHSGLAPDVAELRATLDELRGHLDALLELASRKLDAMRAADVPALNVCAAEEERELQKLLRREDQREAVLARLAQTLRCGGQHPARLSEIASRLPTPFSSEILAKSSGLRELAARLEEKNRLVGAVARSVQSHVRAVFAAVTRANQEPVVYGRSGQHESLTTRAWVDAVA